MKTRIVARAVVYDAELNMILLVRNKDADFWYIPGGGWEHENENILECAVREVREETGLEVEIGKLLYLQEFHNSPETVVFEPFWLASVKGSAVLNEDHKDSDGSVGESRWFAKEDMVGVTVYPEIFKGAFWDNIENMVESDDRFLGVDWKAE